MRNGVVALLALLAMSSPGTAGAGIELISRVPLRLAPDTATGVPVRPALSDDGRYVAFLSAAPNLVPGQIDPDPSVDIFLHDRVAGTTRLVTHAAGSEVTAADRGVELQTPALSADGRFVAFTSPARDLVPDLEDGATFDVYLWDRETGETTLVSRRAGTGEAADGDSLTPTLSADGGVLAFVSTATDLVPGTTVEDQEQNVYLYERATGTVTLVSRSAASASRSGDAPSFAPAVSADGRFVAYLSGATDLIAGKSDVNFALDVFLYDRLTGATTLVSHAAGSTLVTPNRGSQSPGLSGDGRYVVFSSHATDLVPGVSDTNDSPDTFLFDRLQGTVAFVSLSGSPPHVADSGYEPRISRDGGTVIYFLDDPARHAQGGQIVAYDVATGSRSLVTRAPESPFTFGNRGANSVSLSADGRIVAFTSYVTNLVAGQEDLSRAFPDVFVHDRATGVTALVSHAAGSPARTGPFGSSEPALSADGSWIAYGSFDPNLVAGLRDAGTFPDVFLYERATGTNRAATVHPPGLASTSLTTFADSHGPSVSGDGRYVAFSSYGPPLVPGIGTSVRNGDIYLHDRVTRRTVLVSRSTGAAFTGGNADSQQPRISRDGSVVVFHSLATDLAPGQRDRPGTYDVFLWDRRTGRTTLVSRSHASRTRTGAGNSFIAGVSADGNVVAFQGSATDLVPRQRQASASNVFLWDRRTGAVTLVSHRFNRPSQTGNDASLFSSMSADGTLIAFDSIASDLVVPARDANGLNDAFLFERRTGQVTLLSRAGGSFAGRSPLLSADGRRAAFVARNRQRTQESLVVLDRLTGGTAEAVPSTSLVRALHGLSDDGRWLLFTSDAPDLVPGQAEDEPHDDLFLFDSVSRQVRLVSHAPGDPARAAGRTGSASLSPDGRWTAFISYSPLLFPGEDGLQFPNLFLYDRTTEEVTLVTRSVFDPARPGNRESFQPVALDGGLVAFSSQSSNLVPRDFNGSLTDVFVHLSEED